MPPRLARARRLRVHRTQLPSTAQHGNPHRTPPPAIGWWPVADGGRWPTAGGRPTAAAAAAAAAECVRERRGLHAAPRNQMLGPYGAGPPKKTPSTWKNAKGHHPGISSKYNKAGPFSSWILRNPGRGGYCPRQVQNRARFVERFDLPSLGRPPPASGGPPFPVPWWCPPGGWPARAGWGGGAGPRASAECAGPRWPDLPCSCSTLASRTLHACSVRCIGPGSLAAAPTRAGRRPARVGSAVGRAR